MLVLFFACWTSSNSYVSLVMFVIYFELVLQWLLFCSVLLLSCLAWCDRTNETNRTNNWFFDWLNVPEQPYGAICLSSFVVHFSLWQFALVSLTLTESNHSVTHSIAVCVCGSRIVCSKNTTYWILSEYSVEILVETHLLDKMIFCSFSLWNILIKWEIKEKTILVFRWVLVAG